MIDSPLYTMPRLTREEIREQEAENAKNVEAFQRANERAKLLMVPNIMARGPFSTHGDMLPGEYVINTQEGTITWYIAQKPDGKNGWTSGAMVSANTQENVDALINAGYEQGSWVGVQLDRIHKDSRAAIEQLITIAA